ncbi:hypothetical protein [Nocardioides sp.]|uniref:hypothetical protein n=1 Tax=Nocardioides sp. TaxID=35761 RepID=UPI00321BF57A
MPRSSLHAPPAPSVLLAHPVLAAHPVLPARRIAESLRRIVTALLATCLIGLTVVGPAPTAQARTAVEDYAAWQPATRCSPRPKPGAKALGRWLTRRYDGGATSISRACRGSSSEHTEGRAVDWRLDATRTADRRTAKRFLERLLRTDKQGNPHALARRMGVMYVIWNDQMYAAWDAFEPEPYLSSSCRKRKRCSPTLRHRDHVHISLTRRGGKGRTSWYDGRV